MLRNYVKVLHRNAAAKDLWQKVINLRRREYSDVRALAVILIALSMLNSSLEHAFTILTNILSKGCLSVNHRKMEFILIIRANDKNLNDVERSEIIE